MISVKELMEMDDETACRLRAFDLMLQSATRHPVDLQRAIIGLRAARTFGPEMHRLVQQIILDNRRNWLAWLTWQQRKAQMKNNVRNWDAHSWKAYETAIRCL